MTPAQIAKLAKKLKISSKKAEQLLEKQKKMSKTTQKGIKFGKKKDIVMPKDTDIKLSTVSGTKGVTGRSEVINVGDDAMGFSNFLALQKSKGILKREKALRALEKIKKEGTPAQKKQATAMLEKMEASKKKSDETATRKQTGGQRGPNKLPDGEYVNKQTGQVVTNPKVQSELTKGGGTVNNINNWVKDPGPNVMKAIERNRIAREKSDFRRDVEAKTSVPKTAPISTGSAVENKRKIGMNKGGLKMPTADQVGLKKLPTPVRNKMGYMYGGGMMKKPRMSSMDYRKGGLLILAIDMMKKKNKKGNK